MSQANSHDSSNDTSVASAAKLSASESKRYIRQMLLPDWLETAAQRKLKAAKVLVVGAGGLGGPVIAALAGAGVGQLWIADNDTVSLSNLHRQILYSTRHIGQPKTQAARAWVQAQNPYVQTKALPAFGASNWQMEWLTQADLVMDCTDNFSTRYALADACKAASKSCVWGAASGLSGLLTVFDGDYTLRELFDEEEARKGEISCDEGGVLGPVPNAVGNMMALEALKILSGLGQPLRGKLWTLDALTGRVRVIKLRAP